MKHAFFAVCLSFFAAHAVAASFYELDPEVREKAKQLLREKNIDYRAVASSMLKEKGEHFDRARIEVTGMISNDDTYKFNTTDFDDQIKPSYSADKNRSLSDRFWAWTGQNVRDDKREMIHAMRGEMSKRAKDTVAEYKNMEINEIVAHSWGTELVYAAILNGEMRPPKKLIVVGVPDDDHAKWEMLAARTGTEVHWGRAENDAAALDEGVKVAKRNAGNVDFKAKWDAFCAGEGKGRSCPAHNRKPKPVIYETIGRLSGFLAHDREDYYEILKEKKVIKYSHRALRIPETAKINAEAGKLEEKTIQAALIEARELVAQAKAQAEIALRDHDIRLSAALGDLAQRSCSTPGSVTQAELDNLPRQNRSETLLENRPYGLGGDCYRRLYEYLADGRANAGVVETMSLPERTPVDARVKAPIQEPVGARSAPPEPFSTILPKLKNLAITACRAPDQAYMDSYLYRAYDYSYREYDDNLASSLSSGLDACPKQLFDRLIATHRAHEYGRIDTRWIREMVSLYSPRYSAPPAYTPPPLTLPPKTSPAKC